MRFERFGRMSARLILSALTILVLGCSGGPEATPPDKDTSKKIAADVKAARHELKEERAQSAKEGRDGMRDRMKAARRGR